MGACYTKAEAKAAKAEATRKAVHRVPEARPEVQVPEARPEPVPQSVVVPEAQAKPEPEPVNPDPVEPTIVEDTEDLILDVDIATTKPNPFNIYSSAFISLLVITMVIFASN